MTRFTKITASIGPSCENINTLTQMIKAGVNVCRLNFSHDTNDVQGAKIDMIRSVAKNLGVPVAIMIDILMNVKVSNKIDELKNKSNGQIIQLGLQSNQ